MPARKTCAECGAKERLPFRDETLVVEHDGASEAVKGLSGHRCGVCGDVVFDADSARRYAEAGDRLVLAARSRQQKEIRRIRRKLRLTQVEASRLTGGGHNAFSRYERGEATPLPAVVNLLRLLDKHPELLKELGQTG
ncbi:MAG: type II TA system antitoxin MqsA family protein [Sphingomonadales bacterium]